MVAIKKTETRRAVKSLSDDDYSSPNISALNTRVLTLENAKTAKTIIVGTSQEIADGNATHTIENFVAALVNGDQVLILNGTHTLTRNEDITETDVLVEVESSESILDMASFTLTLSGLRSQFRGRVTNTTTGSLIGSAQGVLFDITGADYTAFNLSGGARGKIVGSQTVEVLSGSGTWIKPDDVRAVSVTLVSGGAGGGGAAGADSLVTSGSGGGGTGGRELTTFLPVSGDVSYNVGAGGAGGAGGGTNTNGVPGGTGTATNFGSIHVPTVLVMTSSHGKSNSNGGGAGQGGDGGDISGLSTSANKGGNGRSGASTGPGATGGAGTGSKFTGADGAAGGAGGTPSVGAEGGSAGTNLCEPGGGGGGGDADDVGAQTGQDGANATAFGAGGGGGGGAGTPNATGGAGGNGFAGTIILMY